VSAARGKVARPLVPRAAVGVRVHKALHVSRVRGLVARRFLPHARRVPRHADGTAQLHAVDVSVEGGHLQYVVDQAVVRVHFGEHCPPVATWSKTIGVRVELYYFQYRVATHL